jgi:rod shape determining protein RodA
MFALLKRQDWLLNGSVMGLLGASLLMLASISRDLFIQQLSWSILSIVLILMFSQIDWRGLASYRWIIASIYFSSIALLAIAYFFAPAIRGIRAWLVFGPMQFQVSEFAKIALIIFLAYFFSRQHVGIARVSNIFRSFIYFLIPAIFIFFQPDMGTLIILFCIWGGFLLISGLPIRFLIIGFIIIGIVGAIGWSSVLKDYQRERIIGLFQPNYDPLGVNYSTIQSKIAVGSGGFFGKGFGQGTQVQLGFLPEPSTDYIFASFMEEWGLFGGLIVTVLFGVLIFCLIRAGLYADGNFYRFVCLGTAIMFLIQFSINLGSALGMLPVIGITFPFFSYGGSSILISAIMVGIVQSAVVNRSLS